MTANRNKMTCCGTYLDDSASRGPDGLLTFDEYIAQPGVRQRAPDGHLEHYRFRRTECAVCGCQFAVWYRQTMDGGWILDDSSYWHSFSDEPPYDGDADGLLVDVVDLVEAMRTGRPLKFGVGMQVYAILWRDGVPSIVRGRAASVTEDTVEIDRDGEVDSAPLSEVFLTHAEARLSLSSTVLWRLERLFSDVMAGAALGDFSRVWKRLPPVTR